MGVVVETLWCLLRNKRFESRKGLIYGPFNLVYGFGALIMTLSLSWLNNSRDLWIFLLGSLIGGIYEYGCSFLQEKLLHTVSWDYKSFPLNLNGRINLLYCLFWGVLALLWVRDFYPRMSALINKIPITYDSIFAWIGLIFIIFDSVISALAIYRMHIRQKNIPPSNKIWKLMDKLYPDERLRKIYPNMTFEKINNENEEKQEVTEEKSEQKIEMSCF